MSDAQNVSVRVPVANGIKSGRVSLKCVCRSFRELGNLQVDTNARCCFPRQCQLDMDSCQVLSAPHQL